MPEDHRVMVSRGRHPKKAIADALADVVQDGVVEVEEIHRGHRWGVLTCTICGGPAGNMVHAARAGELARQIHRFADRHLHEEKMG
jgi:hypothetical protein